MKDTDTNLAPKCHHDAGMLQPAIMTQRLRRSVSHKSGQNGYIEKKPRSGFIVGRFRQYVPGRSKPIYLPVRICPSKGPGRLTKPQQRARLKQIIQESGANSVEQVRTAVSVNQAVTFSEQTPRWLQEMRERRGTPVKPRTIANWESHLAWLLPRIGDVLLPDLNPRRGKELVRMMWKAELAPKTINNYFFVFQAVIASAKDDEGAELYPRKWDRKFLDLPKVNRADQQRPTYTALQIEEIIKQAIVPQEAMLYALLPGAGLRIGEALGLEVPHFHDGALHIQQALWNGVAFSPKTENGVRVVDLPEELAEVLRQFLSTRRSGFIFQTEKGTALHQSNLLRRSLYPILQRMGLPKQGFHGFRRFRITHLRKLRIAESVIRQWAGHSCKGVTDGYDRNGEDEAFRKACVEQAGLGFRLGNFLDLPNLHPSAPLASRFHNSVQTAVA
jgi:integrase